MATIDPRVTGPNLNGDDIDGTGNHYYDVIWFIQESMISSRRLEGFIKDAQKAPNKNLVAIYEEAKKNTEMSCAKAEAEFKVI